MCRQKSLDKPQTFNTSLVRKDQKQNLAWKFWNRDVNIKQKLLAICRKLLISLSHFRMWGRSQAFTIGMAQALKII